MLQPETVSTPPRIILAAPDPAARHSLALALTADFGQQIVGQAGDGNELLTVARDSKPDVIVVDLDLERVPALEALAQITEQHLSAIVALTESANRERLASLLREPIHACLPRPAAPTQVGFAVEFARKQFQALRRLVAANEALETTIANRKVIERAKGLLMKQYHWDEPEAFRRLQRAAMNRRVSMAELASQVLEEGSLQF